MLGATEVAESVPTQIAEVESGPALVDDEVVGGTGDEDLAAVADGTESCGADDRLAGVVGVVAEVGLAGMPPCASTRSARIS